VKAEHSRLLRLAAAASGESESRLERRLNRAIASVGVEAELPGATATAALLIETLARGPGKVELDSRGLTQPQIDQILAPAMRLGGAAVSLAPPHPDAARVRIGSISDAGIPRLIPDAHGMRLTRAEQPLLQRHEPSSLGLMYTAAIAAGEIFKEGAGVGPERCRRPDQLDFCPVSLSPDLGFAAAASLRPDLALGLVGNGAIGTAVARILGGLEVPGNPAVLLVDPEIYEIENRGTYSLGTMADVEEKRRKVQLAAGALPGWRTSAHEGPVGEVAALIDSGELPWPPVVIAGLDSIEARHAAQSIWPDLLIDAATGDTAVGISEATATGPCLHCFFPQQAGTASAAAQLAEVLGLPIELVMRGERKLELDQLEGLSGAQRERLLPHLGKPICGLASAFNLGAAEDDSYRPSVPFVSQQAACLAVGRLLAIDAGIEGLPNAVQYDSMIGPAHMTKMRRRPKPGCRCQQRSEVISAVRQSRRRGRTFSSSP
jgi:hypothetical protein